MPDWHDSKVPVLVFVLYFVALFDDMLCTAMSCSATLNGSKGEALLDMTDAPVDIGDRVGTSLGTLCSLPCLIPIRT